MKWVVYTLLVLNFGYYLFDDWRAAQSTLLPDASFLEIASTYATTFDELGWFGVLFLLEVETYWIEDETKLGPIYWFMQLARVICYVFITHTLYAFIVTVIDLGNATVLTDAGGLCALVGEDLSLTRNLVYELIDASNCANLSAGGEIYRFCGTLRGYPRAKGPDRADERGHPRAGGEHLSSNRLQTGRSAGLQRPLPL